MKRDIPEARNNTQFATWIGSPIISSVLLREGFYRTAVNQWSDYSRESPGTCSISLKNLRQLPGNGVWMVSTGGNIAAGKIQARCFETTPGTEFELALMPAS